MEYLGSHHQVFGAGPLKLGHIAYVVEDPKTMADSTVVCWASGYRTGSRTYLFSYGATRTITP